MTDVSPAADVAVFPSADRSAWDDLVDRESKGRPPRGRRTRSGLERQVVYAADDLPDALDARRRGPHDGATLPGARPWIAIQRHADADLDRLNAALAEDIDGGVDGLWIDLRASGAQSSAWLGKAVRGLDLSGLGYLGLDGCADAHGRLRFVTEWAESAGVDLSGVTLSVRADPLRTLATDGVVEGNLQLALDRLERAIDLAGRLPSCRPITLSAEPITRAGGHLGHALGWLLANGAWVLRGLEMRLRPVDVAAPFIELHLPLGRDLFEGIAAVRALRIVWAKLLAAFGHDEPPAVFVHADASASGATRYDPWVNMLRSTGQVFAGIVGGADAITAAPFDAPHGLPGRLGRRVARNTHHVLGEEAHLGDVLDPAGGSWYLEALTDQLARAAWAEMQAIEAAGGAAEVLTSGWLRERLDRAWESHRQRVSLRKEPITGVSEFAHVGESLPTREPLPTADTSGIEGLRIDPLPTRQDAADFERLRDATASSGPTVFLATVGPRAEWNARSLWTRNVFAAAGFEVVEDDGGDPADLTGLIARRKGSEAAVTCIVASDARYPDVVPTLREALSGPVLLAGRPPDEPWAAGLPAVHVGADIGGLLNGLLGDLGVL